MEDFPARIAHMLEQAATRVRSLTVDRMAKAINWASAAPVLLVFFLVGIVLITVGVFRLLAELTGGVRIAYAIIGGLFLLTGAFLWSRRIAKTEDVE